MDVVKREAIKAATALRSDVVTRAGLSSKRVQSQLWRKRRCDNVHVLRPVKAAPWAPHFDNSLLGCVQVWMQQTFIRFPPSQTVCEFL